ncbi:Dyp-type peroxidase [Motiliproteus sediminis]|uniref:Dyp-type peroxidase n=1 Tax=Motiliproteus sediminis TaxID=1468178 RepID=UPI001AEFC368|nr:Dyp-type peroxidase [Motiliproteus sediminis]
MQHAQPGILAEVPLQARYLTFQLKPGCNINGLRDELEALAVSERLVVGLGASLLARLELCVPPLHAFPQYDAASIQLPSTPAALWCWLRGNDRGELLLQSSGLQQQLAPWLELSEAVDAFRFLEGRDLTGYVDGTENPQGEEARQAAFTQEGTLQGSSFVAVQRWRHRMESFDAMSQTEKDHSVGRRLSDNEELDDAPESAHVKRTAQESFAPEAFLLRRSMPWNRGQEQGLMFVAFGHDLQAFEQQLRRMYGLEDGIVDALFRFTLPETGAYFWCPPTDSGQLQLDAAARK